MNQLLYIRKARFIMLRDGRRSLSISTNLFGNNRVMAKQKRTVDVTKPVSYTEYMKPHHVGRLKTWHSINTSNLEGHGGQPHGTNHTANDIYEDLFIRKFIIGVFHHQTVPEQGIAVLRRLNEIEVIVTTTMKYNPFKRPEADPPGTIRDKFPKKQFDFDQVEDFYFKVGFAETILTQQLCRHVKVTLKFANRNELAYNYI